MNALFAGAVAYPALTCLLLFPFSGCSIPSYKFWPTGRISRVSGTCVSDEQGYTLKALTTFSDVTGSSTTLSFGNKVDIHLIAV